MSRLYDRLRRFGPKRSIYTQRAGDWVSAMLDESRPPTVVACDNVTEFYFEITDSSWKDFVDSGVILAPPFDRCFLETKAPLFMRDPGNGDVLPWSDCWFDEWGAYVESFDAHEDFSNIADRDEQYEAQRKYVRDLIGLPSPTWSSASGHDDKSRDLLEPVRWILCLHHYVKARGDKTPYGPMASQLIALRPNGQVARLDNGLPVASLNPLAKENEGRDFVASVLNQTFGSLMLSLAFMNCKNIHSIENSPPAKLARKHYRKHGFAPVAYRTLEIGPITGVLRKEGNLGQNGLGKALHICRGHFATYSDDKPLFGKYAGTYWKPQHVRGSKKHGEVVKD